MTTRNTRKGRVAPEADTAAPEADTAAPAAPAEKASPVAAVLATITEAVTVAASEDDAVNAATITAATHAAVRPLTKGNRANLLASIAENAPTFGGHLATVLQAVSSAPTGADPAEKVAALVTRRSAELAALIGAAGLTWPTEAPAVTPSQEDDARETVAAILAGRGGDGRESHGRTLAELVAAGVTSITTRHGGTDHRATVTADAVTVGKVAHGSLSAAGRAVTGAGAFQGWRDWKTADGRTCAEVVDQARNA